MYKDDLHIWRLDTRLSASDLPYMTKNPVWLPSDSPITSKVIQHYHEQAFHQNDQTVLNEMRKQYWISTRRVKLTTNKCLKCRGYKTKPFRMPTFAQLPKSRVQVGVPFDSTGLDVLGPMKAKDGLVYVLLFTCLKIRAVHIEMVQSTKQNTY